MNIVKMRNFWRSCQHLSSASLGNGSSRLRSLPVTLKGVWLLLLFVGLVSCDRNEAIIQLWTDRVEMAAYVEMFNATDNKTKVELIYMAEPARELLRATEPPDVVFGPWLTSPELQRVLSPLDQIVDEGVLGLEFIKELLAVGIVEGRQLALPFSFNLPVVVFAQTSAPPGIDQFVLTPDELRRLGNEHTRGNPQRLTHIGFSPLWDVDFVYTIAQSFGAGFTTSPDGQITIADVPLTQAITVARDWILTSHGIANDQQFVESYFHHPLYQLVLQGRISFYTTDIAELWLVPQQKRELLDFRWLSLNGRIPIIDDYRSFVIPAGATNEAGAREFLMWIFEPEIQAQLLKTTISKRLRTFGLAGGFSVLSSVNERVLPRSHEFLIGRLPPNDILEISKPAPVFWGSAKVQVVLPWLKEAIVDGTPVHDYADDLLESISYWRRRVQFPQP